MSRVRPAGVRGDTNNLPVFESEQLARDGGLRERSFGSLFHSAVAVLRCTAYLFVRGFTEGVSRSVAAPVTKAARFTKLKHIEVLACTIVGPPN